jgi:glucose dehydrogenase
MNTIDARLVAIDADTGAMCEGLRHQWSASST